jgi:hypothetical protein
VDNYYDQMKRLNCFLLFAILIGVYAPTYAQITSSTLSGRIVDAEGQSLAGVTIEALNNGTGAKYTASSNADGRFTMANLNPGGPYTIQASFLGYKTDKVLNLNLGLGASTVNFVLTAESSMMEEVVVSRQNPSRSRGGHRINEKMIKEMPSINRSLQDFTRTTPQSANNSFLGTNFRYNNVTLDGAINNDAIGFSPSLGGQGNTSGQPGSSTRTNPVSMDAIQDIQVYLAPFDVKIGNFLGGSINAVTRSGSMMYRAPCMVLAETQQ